MKTATSILLGGVCGGILSALWFMQVSSLDSPQTNSTVTDPAPLYWVAPMDPNFRRDQPGKSPMGMDLVPVFAESGQGDAPGVVKISPNVVNNLGVRTAKVIQGVLQDPIKTVGYVQYNENTLLHVHPRVEGWVEKLYIKAAGEQVNEGEPLYALYSPELVNAQEEYLLAKKRNNQVLTLAAESRLLALQMPAASIDQLTKSLKVQQTIVFYAPQTGVIDNLAIREGFFVKPGTTLMSIGALDDVWVKAEVFERQAAQVQQGQLVTMTLGFVPGKTWHGQVDYVYPTLDAQTRTLRVRLRFDNPDNLLKPNMFAQVVIHTQSAQKILLVPREAVIRTGEQDRVVLALAPGQYKSVQVTLGQITQQFAQIIDGVADGDSVVTSAQFLLDSESSIQSDFKRMSGGDASSRNNQRTDTAMVEGVINQIDHHTRVANISRGPIEKWGRGPATMDFVFTDNLALTDLQPGDKMLFTFEIQSGGFVVTEYSVTDWEHSHD